MSGDSTAGVISRDTIEEIVRRATKEVWQELTRRGVELPAAAAALPDGAVRIDLSGYRTPLLTERAVARMHARSNTAVVPRGTIVTPRAKELLREKNINVIFE